MPLQQFLTYDLIADIIPGTLLILLTIPLLPSTLEEPIVESALLAGATLIIGGYVTGRIIHATSGTISRIKYSPFDDNTIKDIIKNANNSDAENDELLQEFLNERDLKKLNASIVTNTLKNLPNELTNTTPENMNKTYESTKHYGETLLYGHTNLYDRYQTLTIFYRNLITILLPLTIIYLAYNLNPHLSSFGPTITTIPPPESHHLLLSIALLAALILSYIRYHTFTDRRNRTYFNDLHQLLNQNDNQ